MIDAVTIACVWVGERYGAAYPRILQDMVRRSLPRDTALRFVCITDRPDELPAGMEAIEPEPGMPGWWQKVALFKPGKLPGGRIAYFDLDVAIVGELSSLIDRPGIIKDWHLPTYNSSVMVWDAGDHAMAWELFRDGIMSELPGDQDWLTEIGGWDSLPPEWCVSYRSHASLWPPARAKVVVFHGRPKPHEIADGWVPSVWRERGMSALPKMEGVNVASDVLIDNVRSACQRDFPWFYPQPEHDRECVIVGGGPSAAECWHEIYERVKAGAALWSLNGSARWLLSLGMTPDFHVVLDARPENAEFVKGLPASVLVMAASQCHPKTWDMLEGRQNTWLWHAAQPGPGFEAIVDGYIDEGEKALLVGGGSTVGLRALNLAHQAGYRKAHLYGYDSCFQGRGHHAYSQPLNDGDRPITVVMAGREYRAAGWHARQANDFNTQYEILGLHGLQIEAHGRGLIPDICRILNAGKAAARGDLEKCQGVWWPRHDVVGRAVIPSEVAKIADVLPLCKGRAVAVQAGANVGLVPMALAAHFNRVIAFEPEPTTIAAARLNINGAKVELRHAALGASAGMVRTCGPVDNCGATRTAPGSEVPLQTIDGLELEACDLIWLDIEGDELAALTGAVETLAKFRPVVLVEDKGPERGKAPDWLRRRFDYRQAAKLLNDVVLVPN